MSALDLYSLSAFDLPFRGVSSGSFRWKEIPRESITSTTLSLIVMAIPRKNKMRGRVFGRARAGAYCIKLHDRPYVGVVFGAGVTGAGVVGGGVTGTDFRLNLAPRARRMSATYGTRSACSGRRARRLARA